MKLIVKKNIGITAPTGKMGKVLLHILYHHPGASISGGTVRKNHPSLGRDIGEVIGESHCNIKLTSDIHELCRKSDAIIDFSRPSHALEACEIATHYSVPFITGTTGFTPKEEGMLKVFATHIPLIQASNMSLGINVLHAFIEKTARILDDSYDIEIFEMHHRHKVDAPSGTALYLSEAASKGRGSEEVYFSSDRNGTRIPGAIHISSARGGDVVGEHRVIFAGQGERIEYHHIASDRSIFAKGAIKAALWACTQKPGLYTMKEVLGLQ